MFRRLLFVLSLFIVAACGATPTPVAAPTARPAATATRAAVPTPISVTTVRCAFAGSGATITLNNQRLSFTCPQQGNDETGLLGTPKSQAKDVEIERAVYSHDANGFTLKSSATVKIAVVELTDGERCAFAGTGITASFAGKRLNFNCGTQGANTVALIGDMVSGSNGFTIEKTALAKTAAGNLAITGTGVTTVQIAALDVYLP